MINFKTLITLLLITPLLLGCPATTQSLKEKNDVREELIIEIQNIKDKGAAKTFPPVRNFGGKNNASYYPRFCPRLS